MKPAADSAPVAPGFISLHGGHSGQFCEHAVDLLAEIVEAYWHRGAAVVGFTEHMAPLGDQFLYPDEVAAGWDAAGLQKRFEFYFQTCRALKEQYAGQMEILVAFETETYSGSEAFIRQLLEQYRPDYFVGSLHHVGDQGFDFSPADYRVLVDSVGGIEALYCRYFDEQYDMIKALQPAVVGHFDLIRVYDPDYSERWRQGDIWQRVERNLDLVQRLGLILDFNLGGFDKAGGEQFPCRPILAAAIERGIALVPGDDSHGVGTVGRHFDRGVALLRELGADMEWRLPGKMG
ncbi:MAG: histidinol-phosphatase HisJ family protein [Candidatus Latescibacteria bacterium]|nr:histidinol-phosphatase HisJ family protein [Candidatus Latescibacterota bacterium]